MCLDWLAEAVRSKGKVVLNRTGWNQRKTGWENMEQQNGALYGSAGHSGGRITSMFAFYCSFNEIKWIFKKKKNRVVDTWQQLRAERVPNLLDKHATAAGMNGIAASKILLELVWPSLSLKLILLNPACGGRCEQRSLVMECPQITGSTVRCMQNGSLNQQHLQLESNTGKWF